MSALRFLSRLKLLSRRGRMEDDLSEELQFHLQKEIEKNIKSGVSAEEARYAALRSFGGVDLVKENCRDLRRVLWIGILRQDISYGMRMLRRNPRFTAVAIATLALGIGATTVIFSVIDNVLLRPFPYRDAERLTRIYEHFESGALDRPWLEPEEFVDLNEQDHSFEDMIGVSTLEVFYKGREGTQWAVGGRVTPNTFDFLGIKPLFGRPIGSADGDPSAQPVFAMSHRMWEDQFNRDPGLVGSVLTLNGEPRTLVAIMPERFRLFDLDIWIPLKVTRQTALIGANNMPAHFAAVGRLKPGVSLAGC